MNKESSKIKSFMDLYAWKEGHKLVLLIYQIMKQLPKEELFGLIMQMRRASVSITSNIAEGFSRQSYKEKVQFYAIALGSTTELQNQLIISKDIQILTQADFDIIGDQIIKAHKIINGLIKGAKAIIHDS